MANPHLFILGTFLFLLVLFTFMGGTNVSFGDITQAVIFHQIRKYVLILGQKRPIHQKFWRPSLLVIETGVGGKGV
jgi:potassium/chloride transporter 9